MHCASCSTIIEKTLKKVEGVESVEANYGTEKAKISFDPAKISVYDMSKHLEPLGYSLEVPEDHMAHTDIGDMRNKVISVIPLAIFSILIMIWDFFVGG